MKFEETDYIDLTDTPIIFVYFLVYNNDVVYVGQTTRGLARVYTHAYSKKFNKIYVIECDEEELDYLEDHYIFKYKPIYNKRPNFKCNFSLSRIVHELNKQYKSGVFDYKITKPKVKKMIKELKIKPREYDGENYINIEDYQMITSCIEDYAKGAPLSEVFDIGI